MSWFFGWMNGRLPSRTPSPELRAEPLRPLEDPVYRNRDIYGRDIFSQRHDGRSFRVCLKGSGAVAIGRPSSGGILFKEVDAIDMKFLDVSRAEPTWIPESNDPATEEDEWCTKLRKLAPGWWRNHLDRKCMDEDLCPLTPAERETVLIGWPSNGHGVWILKYQRGRPPAAYGLCLTMDERCEVLRRNGAQFFANPSDCIEVTEQYEARFRRERDELDPELEEIRRMITNTGQCGGDM